MRYWLMKSEPDVFGIADLVKRPKRTESWDGVRNYQARNFLRDEMQRGDLALFYHSSCAEPGVAGMVKIVRAGYPDASARNRKSKYYDARSTADNPIWYTVDVQLVRPFRHVVTLAELKAVPALRRMRLLQPGNRLSILPLTHAEWRIIVNLENAGPSKP
jgi:predicted RNA-binding protein with PUA-like domain